VRERLLALRLDVPVSVWEVALRCLEAHGPDRYPDASALRLAFRQAHAGFITAPGFASGTALPGALSYVPTPPPTVTPAPGPVQSADEATPAPPAPWAHQPTPTAAPLLGHPSLALAQTVLAAPTPALTPVASPTSTHTPWWKLLLLVVGVAILSAGLLLGAVVAYDLFLEPSVAPSPGGGL
jgi:hypothetical protein